MVGAWSRDHRSDLRIAIVHSFYSAEQPSGENEVVWAELAALNASGVDAHLLARFTDDLSGRLGQRMRNFITTASGYGSSPLADLVSLSPDVVHIHNLFPNFGHKWTQDFRGPLVVTLHNYRPICARATLLRDGRVCTDCFSGPLPGLLHACYRDKRRATLPLTLGQRSAQRDLLDRADRLIVLSAVEREFYMRAGVEEAKFAEVPNFVPDEYDEGPGRGGEGWLFAGRLNHQKGVRELIQSWPPEIPLRLAGGHASESLATAAIGKNIEFLGQLPRADIMRLLRNSRGLVFPSSSPEPFGLVYAEALASGTPVLATPPSAVAELIDRDGTGLAVDALTAGAIRSAHELFTTLRARSRAAFDRLYTESSHVRMLRSVYESVR